ncbi:hypothetical protein ACE1SV_77350 [Streptomyces sennicomposti]
MISGQQAQAEITRAKGTDLAARALPDLIPPRDPPAGWTRPRPASAARRRPDTAPPHSPAPDDAGGTAPASQTEE